MGLCSFECQLDVSDLEDVVRVFDGHTTCCHRRPASALGARPKLALRACVLNAVMQACYTEPQLRSKLSHWLPSTEITLAGTRTLGLATHGGTCDSNPLEPVKPCPPVTDRTAPTTARLLQSFLLTTSTTTTTTGRQLKLRRRLLLQMLLLLLPFSYSYYHYR